MKIGFMRRLRRAIEAFLSEEVAEQAPAPATVPPPAVSPYPVIDAEISPLAVGLRDRMMDGWYRESSGELVAGVPIRPEHTVLDVGCGDGGFVRYCASLGARVIFADILQEKLDRLVAELRDSPARSIEAHLSDCNPLPVADAEADVIICTEVLEHVDDPVVVMRELARVGKPGARYVLTLPDPVSEGLVAATGADFYFRKPNHVRVVSREGFEQLVTDAGLEVEQHDYFGTFWAICLPLTYLVGQRLEPPWHPMIAHWASAWSMMLDQPKGHAMKKALEAVVPRSQFIVARKPG